MNEKEIVIGEVRKNSAEVVQVSVARFKGHVYCGARIWLKDEGGTNQGTPTVKGLTIRADILSELLPLLKSAVEVAEKMDEGREESEG